MDEEKNANLDNDVPPYFLETLGFTEREIQEVKFCNVYATEFAHGSSDHNRMMLVHKLSQLLGEYHEKAQWEKARAAIAQSTQKEVDETYFSHMVETYRHKLPKQVTIGRVNFYQLDVTALKQFVGSIFYDLKEEYKCHTNFSKEFAQYLEDYLQKLMADCIENEG